MMHTPPPPFPAPPTDPAALAAQTRRIRRKRVVRAAFLAAILMGSVFAVWFLSAGQIPTRSEWAFRMTQATDLAARGLDGSGQVVCLVDTGVDPKHPDLVDIPLLAWMDFVQGHATPYDDDGHGTAMAGLIAARGTVKGVAPSVALIVAKALDSRGMGTSQGLAAAITFCTDPNGDGNTADGASIVSLSLAATTNMPVGTEVTAAVNAALAEGVIIVASAGNDGLADDGDVQAPASLPGVIAVGSVDEFGALARFSSIGGGAGRTDPDRKPELVAPGVDLITTARGGGYRLVSGTSASAAFVSGILALLLQAHPAYAHSGQYTTIVTVKTALMHGAIAEPGQLLPHDPHYGYGLIGGAAAESALP